MEYKTALQKAAAYCAQCERAASEVEEKLQKYGVQDVDIEKIIKKLKDEDFLNEQRYCNFFVEDKFRFNRWGKTKIAYMLLLKKVAKESVCQALDIISEDEYLSVLTNLLQSKSKSIKATDKFQKEQKLFRFACSHGFESDVIKQVINNY
jgi:regulatory protein